MYLFLILACIRPQLRPTEQSPVLITQPESSLERLDVTLGQWLKDGKPATIDSDRDARLRDLAAWIKERGDAGLSADLVFVCTHNSRRSHMSQLWAQAAAHHLHLDHVQTYSGGTESTAFNPRAVRALRTHGFVIEESGTVLGERNVVYQTTYGASVSIKSFSKRYDHQENPSSEFAAVMVCSSADRSCPVVLGAETRIAIPYVDPKLSDGTPDEGATYLAKSEEIGREILWMMQQVETKK